MAHLFCQGNGALCIFDDLDKAEQDELIEELIGRFSDELGPEREARRRIAEFHREVTLVRSAHPGVERRRASLENTDEFIKERLLRELRHSRGRDADEYVERLM